VARNAPLVAIGLGARIPPQGQLTNDCTPIPGVCVHGSQKSLEPTRVGRLLPADTRPTARWVARNHGAPRRSRSLVHRARFRDRAGAAELGQASRAGSAPSRSKSRAARRRPASVSLSPVVDVAMMRSAMSWSMVWWCDPCRSAIAGAGEQTIACEIAVALTPRRAGSELVPGTASALRSPLKGPGAQPSVHTTEWTAACLERGVTRRQFRVSGSEPW